MTAAEKWSGQAFMCTRDKEFTIRGTDDCLARGYDRTGFFEVDTGEQQTWTVQLTDSPEQTSQRPAPGSPLTTIPPAQGNRRSSLAEVLIDETSAARQDHCDARSRFPDEAAIERLFEAGADVFRINMSHSTPDQMREMVHMIRAVERTQGRPIAALVDLQGPKLRIGTFEQDMVRLEKGGTFVLDSDPAPGNGERVHVPHPEVLASLERGHRLCSMMAGFASRSSIRRPAA